jgi:hypothetical protein
VTHVIHNVVFFKKIMYLITTTAEVVIYINKKRIKIIPILKINSMLPTFLIFTKGNHHTVICNTHILCTFKIVVNNALLRVQKQNVVKHRNSNK